MAALQVRPVRTDTEIADWRYAHNVVIPNDPLSLDEVRERLGRNRLDVAYRDEVLVGNSTVRPPAEPGAAAVVIVRVLPEHRGQGSGGSSTTTPSGTRGSWAGTESKRSCGRPTPAA
ncbi:GNAT family N-acetyltransferase, partial [Catellatospora methionotrophica]|uniref:GNAT family N-acetyltransferase n=1 Tax=Catellatospora methionotrophica TaxID=121620 RepID=UPI0031D50400